VWVTVLVARLIGGVIGGYAGYALLHGSTTDAQVLLPALVTAAVTGVAITVLLPGLSGSTIGSGSAATAAFVGAVAPLLAGLAVARGALAPSASGVGILGGAGPVLVIAANIVGVAITAWMVSTSAVASAGWRIEPSEPLRRWDDRETAEVLDPAPTDRLSGGYWSSMEEQDRAA
jgi:hypothetical protein